ncbi:DNA-binding MarR family transcriptional regulator [Edaphobacter aggregans]|jgi:DNA-binding MarR family transcriptional regulator|uniref:DNA-binding MarR family transcriptional regulator n=1 Tax=Edaphobacter aggregans TaxID=570835 RepID=A0A3R9PPI5_9BACT|nr:MarR family transcriptional regulator [Edaphobacter aggregans]RSL14989.1 DNA-binding MarR family transcriptional regulator [Edaphobacter aggregans]
MKRSPANPQKVDDSQSITLHGCIATLLRRFKLEPGILAGSAYADLHANDIGLLQVLAEPGDWSVRKIAQALQSPITTISSALDRLEARRVVVRQRRPSDRRTVYIELTSIGLRLAAKLRDVQVENCRLMLLQLAPNERDELLRLVSKIVGR